MTTQTIKARFKFARKTTAEWAAETRVLLAGEPAIEITTSGSEREKRGDGVHLWADLPYVSGGNGGAVTDLSIGTRTATTMVVASSSGNDATLPAATSTQAGLMPAAAVVSLNNAEPGGTAAAVMATHLAAADPHPGYTTPAEAAAAAPVQSVTLAGPAGWSSSSTNTGGSVTLTLALPTGYSLPSDASQANWNTAYGERLRWDGGGTGLNAATGRASLGLATVATSGAYGDLFGRPTLGTAAATDVSAYATAAQGALAATAVQPAALTAKADLVGGVVPSAQLPGFVDDVLEFANVAAFPATGETGKLYVSLAANRVYRWSGSVYIEINPSPGSTDAVPEGSVNLYFSTARASAAAPVQSVAGRTGAVTLAVADVSGAVSSSDSRLGDSREWSAATATQTEAEAGTSTSRLAFSPLRVFQAIAAWWAGSSAASKLAGVASGATANATDAQLRDRSTHTGTQAASTITGLATVATSGAYGDLLGRPTLGTLAAQNGIFSGTSSGTNTGDQTITLTGDVTGSGTGSFAATLSATAVSAGAYGSASQVATFTVDTKGRLTAAGSVSISIGSTAISDATPTGLAVVTAATQVAARNAIGAGTSSVVISSSAAQSLGATAAAGSTGQAADAGHIHPRSTYAELGAIGDGLILVISNKGEAATAATNYVEMPVPVPSGSFTLTAVRFGCHIDNTGSSSSTFNAYKRTAGGTKTSVLTGNAALASGASLVDASATITGGTFSAGDRIGVDLVGVGTGASGLFASFIFTRSAT